MAHSQRRVFLQGTLVSALVAAGAAFGLLPPRLSRAADWPRDAYAAKSVEEALQNLYGTSRTLASAQVIARAPRYADNGAVVPVSVSARLPDVQSISILVDKNAHPLAAHLNLLDGAVPYFSVNIKIGASSDVHFVVNASGKLYSAKQSVQVTAGGGGS